ncbi:MAG: hypothetical protein DRJ03_17530 [Chloroflexi bacterium]|nr:MAG: hypothetical protein DRJ03_17530 [Chloroflexota bacterium]
MTPTTGQTLQNRYRIVSRLGQGGMGAVYRAQDTRLNISVAIKEMTPQPGLDTQTLTQLHQQFQQEATVMAHLDHPHLVGVSDFFEEGSNVYLVMKLVEGENLTDRIAREGQLTETEVLVWAGQLLDALVYCHSQGVLHRDIKPQNIIIRPDGRAVLVDFGLVKLWDPNDPRTKTAMRGMGTPEYAPPEQYEIAAGHTDARSDIYGLGATLYHALSGQIPPTATMRIVDPENLISVRALAPGVSAETEAAVAQAIELRPAARFQSAQEMAAALRGIAPTPPKRKRTKTKVMPGARPAALAPARVGLGAGRDGRGNPGCGDDAGATGQKRTTLDHRLCDGNADGNDRRTIAATNSNPTASTDIYRRPADGHADNHTYALGTRTGSRHSARQCRTNRAIGPHQKRHPASRLAARRGYAGRGLLLPYLLFQCSHAGRSAHHPPCRRGY